MLAEINIGLAVALDEGLVTPVIRGADGKSLAQLAAENRDLAARTREGRTRPGGDQRRHLHHHQPGRQRH